MTNTYSTILSGAICAAGLGLAAWLGLGLKGARPVIETDGLAKEVLTPTQRPGGTLVSFLENKGQVRDQHGRPRPDVLFSGEAAGLSYHLLATGLHYQLLRVERWRPEASPGLDFGEGQGEVPDRIGVYRIDVAWAGANPGVRVEPGPALPGHEHFYHVPAGAPSALWVRRYQSLWYRGIYPGIDLHYYRGAHGGLKYDFIVHPGADHRHIRMEIKGADLAVGSQGGLVLDTPFGQVVDAGLWVHQQGRAVAARWVVEGQQVRIEVAGDYDKSLPLVIDPPVQVWGTYLGGSMDERITSCHLDGSGQVYVSGWTASFSNVATSGTHQASFGGGMWDGFIASFDAEGQRQWATYYGGASDDRIYNSALDASGYLYVVGATESVAGIATVGAHQTAIGNALLPDAFLAKFDADGLRVWGTYFGGVQQEEAYGCAIAPGGAVYIAGFSTTTQGLATPGAHQEAYGGGIGASGDAFLAKFDAGGQRLWSTYYGGSKADFAFDCTVDAAGDVYLVGETDSPDQIATPGAHLAQYGGSDNIAYLAKFNSSGQRLWGTYYGSGGITRGRRCVLAPDEQSVYLLGQTRSAEQIATPGAHQEANAGGFDAYLVKFDAHGQRRWGTYLGGAGTDLGIACATDQDGSIYVGGWTESTTGIATPGAHQEAYGGGSDDAFLAKFSSEGLRQWGTYFGDDRSDWGLACATDSNGFVYLAGRTSSPQEIATAGTHQPALSAGTGADGFLAKFSQEGMVHAPDLPTPPHPAVYPSPSSGLFTLDISPDWIGMPYVVHDLQGRVLQRGRLPAAPAVIDLSALPAGAYVLSAGSGTWRWAVRVVKG
jgi:hypothetical protein